MRLNWLATGQQYSASLSCSEKPGNSRRSKTLIICQYACQHLPLLLPCDQFNTARFGLVHRSLARTNSTFLAFSHMPYWPVLQI